MAHAPKVEQCKRGLFTVKCSCSWFVNVKHRSLADALSYYATEHGAAVLNAR